MSPHKYIIICYFHHLLTTPGHVRLMKFLSIYLLERQVYNHHVFCHGKVDILPVSSLWTMAIIILSWFGYFYFFVFGTPCYTYWGEHKYPPTLWCLVWIYWLLRMCVVCPILGFLGILCCWFPFVPFVSDIMSLPFSSPYTFVTLCCLKMPFSSIPTLP